MQRYKRRKNTSKVKKLERSKIKSFSRRLKTLQMRFIVKSERER